MKKNVEILETPGFTRVLSSKFSSCFMGRWFGMKEPLLPKPRRGEEPQIRVFTWAKKRHLKNLYSNEYVSFIYISDSCPINELISNIIQFFSHHGASNQSLYAILFCPISFPKCFPMVPDPRMAAQLLLNQLRDIGVLLQRRVRHLRSEQKASHGHIWDGRFFYSGPRPVWQKRRVGTSGVFVAQSMGWYQGTMIELIKTMLKWCLLIWKTIHGMI